MIATLLFLLCNLTLPTLGIAVRCCLSKEKFTSLHCLPCPANVSLFNHILLEPNLHATAGNAIFDFQLRLGKHEVRVAQNDANKQRGPYVFQSGDIAVVSGLYRADYGHCDASPELRIEKGKQFPTCPQCGKTANFLLERKLDILQKAPNLR